MIGRGKPARLLAPAIIWGDRLRAVFMKASQSDAITFFIVGIGGATSVGVSGVPLAGLLLHDLRCIASTQLCESGYNKRTAWRSAVVFVLTVIFGEDLTVF